MTVMEMMGGMGLMMLFALLARSTTRSCAPRWCRPPSSSSTHQVAYRDASQLDADVRHYDLQR